MLAVLVLVGCNSEITSASEAELECIELCEANYDECPPDMRIAGGGADSCEPTCESLTQQSTWSSCEPQWFERLECEVEGDLCDTRTRCEEPQLAWASCVSTFCEANPERCDRDVVLPPP